MYETEEDEAKQKHTAKAQHSQIRGYGIMFVVFAIGLLIFIAPLFRG